MIPEQPNKALVKANMRTPIFLWAAFVALTLFYTYQAYEKTGSEFRADFPHFDSSNMIVTALIICSMFNLLLAWFLPRFISRNARTLSVKMIAFVVRIALIESIVIYGLVCAIHVKDGNLILPFAIFALLGYIRAFPRPEQFGY